MQRRSGAASHIPAINSEAASVYAKLHRGLLQRGIYLAPSAYEVMIVSLAHDQDTLELTIEAFDAVAAEISGQR